MFHLNANVIFSIRQKINEFDKNTSMNYLSFCSGVKIHIKYIKHLFRHSILFWRGNIFQVMYNETFRRRLRRCCRVLRDCLPSSLTICHS